MYTFRNISANDDAVIAALIRSSLKKNRLDIPGTAYYDSNLDHLSTSYDNEKSGYYVIEDGSGSVIGGIGFSGFPAMKDTAELQKLYLADSAKGKGIGYQMIAFIEDKMVKAGYRFSYLETHDNLQAAIHIYEKSGYRAIPKPHFIGHSAMTRFFLKEL